MRRQEREMDDPAFMHGVLAGAEQLFLAFNAAGAPYIVAVSHLFHGGALWFHCAGEGRKLDLLRADPRLGFFAATDIAQDGTTMRYRSVYGTGLAEVIEDQAVKQDILKALAKRFAAPCHLPLSPERLAETLVVRIEIESLTGKYSRRGEGPKKLRPGRTTE